MDQNKAPFCSVDALKLDLDSLLESALIRISMANFIVHLAGFQLPVANDVFEVGSHGIGKTRVN